MMTMIAMALIVFIGIVLLIATIVAKQKRRIRRESRALDEMLFQREKE